MISVFAVLALLAPPAGAPIEGVHHLQRFVGALRGLDMGERAGRVRITHFGDSHIVADLWTAPIRDGLQARFGDGGRGFVLAGRPWSSYRQATMRNTTIGRWRVDGMRGGLDDGWFGVGGCSMASADPRAAIEVSGSQPFTEIDVHFLRQPSGGCFEIKADGQTQRVSTRGPWPSPGFVRLSVTPGPHTVHIRPAAGGETRLFGVSMHRDTGVIYDAIGINGAQATRLLKADPVGFSIFLQRLNPQLVVISYGANELFNQNLTRRRFSRSFARVLERVGNAAPRADCLVTGPPDMLRDGRAPPMIKDVYAIERAMAEAHGCAFWDARVAMGGAGSIRNWLQNGWAQRDSVHLTVKGYRELGNMMLKALLVAVDQP